MNNEPVAWIAVGDNTSVFFDLDCALAIDDNPTPLYTQPAKALTDKDLAGLMQWCLHTLKDLSSITQDSIDELRAILRKAQEK